MRVGIVNRFSGSMYRIGQAIEARGHQWVPIDYHQLHEVDGHAVYEGKDLASLDLDGVLWRISENDYPKTLPLLEATDRTLPLINPLSAIKLCGDKWETYEALKAANLPVVPSTLINPGMPFTPHVKLPPFLASDFDTDTFVLKPVHGAGGNGVRLVLREMWLDGESILQPFAVAASATHYRAQVSGGKVTGIVHRIPLWEDAITNNLEQGGVSRPARPGPEVGELAIAAAAATGTLIAGVDILPSPDGQRLYVLEVNATPGISGMYDSGQPAEPGIAEAIEAYLSR